MTKKFKPADRLASFRFAIRGLRTMLVQEHNSRIHLVAAVAVIIAGSALGLDAGEWRWIILAVAMVWLAEAFNTAIERLGDAVSLEHHPQIGIAKDVAAAGVLIASLCASLIGLSIFVPSVGRWVAS
ncbi:MAG: diacylglycerol kinase family protein [Pseudomonadota bacterium]|nr:diacylglycerol kinase family protein [Pseudomonadota bacterium]